ncbi:DUF72 domain-containing protein [Acidovorax sp.]|uniref:DUF72 domain-containing protein n=1 Tax=Acidovorax sp. TaxID=1872122 RepID=UPI0034451340
MRPLLPTPAYGQAPERKEALMAGPPAAQIRIGISGWRYAPWRGAFYPPGLPQAQELAFAARQFPAIELNGSFYALQRPSSYQRWAEQTPQGFVFAVKAPRYITHILRLRDIRPALANFFASGVLALGPKLGPLLWQLPPGLAFDAGLLDEFLAQLPRDGEAALRLAGEREARMHGKEWLGPVAPLRLQHALEVRDPSFCQPAAAALLQRHGVALVAADTGGRWPELGDATADFVYIRLHGAPKLYASNYGQAALATWAERLRAWAGGGTPPGMARLAATPPPARPRNVFCFFDNTMKPFAAENALALTRMLGLDGELQLPR